MAVAYRPVHDLLGRMTLLAAGWSSLPRSSRGWAAGFINDRLESKQRLEREVIFNENILANMPSGIALVDPVSHHFLHANEAFAQMAERFGDLPAGPQHHGSSIPMT